MAPSDDCVLRRLRPASSQAVSPGRCCWARRPAVMPAGTERHDSLAFPVNEVHASSGISLVAPRTASRDCLSIRHRLGFLVSHSRQEAGNQHLEVSFMQCAQIETNSVVSYTNNDRHLTFTQPRGHFFG